MPDPTAQKKKSFKDTLNLPKTTFSMKANLVQNEPATLKRWQQAKLYEQVRAAAAGRPRYVFHDGPPYANGSIHLGHLLNKVLKDLVVRTKSMAGFDVPYIPGWDCHGLPIEHKVMQELGDKARGMAPLQIRKRCSDYAEKFIKLQMGQMQRLLTLADYDHPYLTMSKEFEAGTLEVFAELVGKGLVYRALKPVHWSIANQTALAEAELEYEDREDTSVYVLFEMTEQGRDGLLDEIVGEDSDLHSEPVFLMIWTTTPWTLPANLAVAVHGSYRYALTRIDGRLVVLAEDLAEKVAKAGGAKQFEHLGHVEGFNLAGLKYRHPFLATCSAPAGESRCDAESVWTIVTADYVTLEDGTGLVHTAPGHGVEDYQTGLRVGLPIYCPVQADGTFDDSTCDWLRGRSVWDANQLVVEKLRAGGHLFHAHQFTHSYPHDWRSKTPVIFRATEQWFVGVDKPLQRAATPLTIRQLALEETADAVQFIPEWGRNRMRGMLESRPDWCLSRQRAWGLPIPAFFGPRAGELLLTKASIAAVAKVVREHGSDAWFKLEAKDLLTHYDPASDPDAPDWLKGQGPRAKGQGAEQSNLTSASMSSPSALGPPPSALPLLRKASDIFDVWFESGSSWHACIEQRGLGHDPKDRPVTDLYLEGSDQHRGWFQCSLLPALGVTGRSPFKAVLTHGFMVDKDGRKMSKSLGNTLEVEDLLKEFGADVCRWWVCSLNTDADIKVDQEFFKVAGEEYRKIRNTIRFLLSNLGDYDAAAHRHHFTEADATSIDAWALEQLNELAGEVKHAYEAFAFRKASEAMFNFCNETMSAVYLAATKDRLYCDKPGSPRRRRTQTAMHEITRSLILLLAPVLPHTADEAWAALHRGEVGSVPSVHLAHLPGRAEVAFDVDWPKVMEQRGDWLRLLEAARQQQGIDNPLDLGLEVPGNDWLVRFSETDLADLCGISRVKFTRDGQPRVLDLRGEPRCERSWKRDGTVMQRGDEATGGMLSERDAAALGI